ncbi:MAG: hypothetical protein Q9224_001265 [Gallowayella concinna]
MTTIIFYLFLLLSSRGSWAFRFPYIAVRDQNTADLHQLDGNPDADLTTLLRSSPDSQDRVYASALQVLESLKASPSCNRLAASALIRSCQSIDGSNPDPEGSLEDVKSVYAAQLAICEITDAGSMAPGSCDPFLPNSPISLSRKLTRSSNLPDPTANALKGKLSFCLHALESRPQHWTSYSNNRQNAVIMCQAARIDVEKDDLIKLHQSLLDTTAGADATLVRALATVNEALMKQKKFGTEVDQFQQQLMHDLKATKADAQSYLGSLTKNMESAFQSMIKQFSEKMKRVETEGDKLETVRPPFRSNMSFSTDGFQILRSSAAEAIELRLNVGSVLQQAVEGSAELAAMQANHLEATASSTSQLRNALHSIRQQEVQSLLGTVDSIHNQLRASNELVGAMYTRQDEIDERLVKLDKSFTGLESTAAALHRTQMADTEARTRLHNQMEIELQVAQGLLADVTASATALQATVLDVNSKVAHMATLGGLSNTIMSWGWSLVTLVVLYQLNPRLAAAILGRLFSMAYRPMPLADSRSIYRAAIHYRNAHHAKSPTARVCRVRYNPIGMDISCLGLCFYLTRSHDPLPINTTITPARGIDFQPDHINSHPKRCRVRPKLESLTVVQ